MPYHQPDFVDAHGQHWNDAELLFQQSRWLNADQLYGISAECGLKAVMLNNGMTLAPSGVPDEYRHRQHVDKLWPEFITTVQGRMGARYLPMLPGANPFTNWSIHNRYANHSHFTDTNVTHHRSGAERVKEVVEKAQQDGEL